MIGFVAIEPPPWSSSAQQPPAPTVSTAPQLQSRSEAKLQETVSVLKKKDDPELQTLAKEADVLQNKTATSKLHKASQTWRCEDHPPGGKTGQIQSSCFMEAIFAGVCHRNRAFLHQRLRQGRQALGGTHPQSRYRTFTAAQESLDEAKKAATEEEPNDQVESIEDEDEGLDRTTKTSQAMREGLILVC